jgi:hypothetical protein
LERSIATDQPGLQVRETRTGLCLCSQQFAVAAEELERLVAPDPCRVARPNAEQAEIITALDLSLPERICADRDVTPKEFAIEQSSEAG